MKKTKHVAKNTIKNSIKNNVKNNMVALVFVLLVCNSCGKKNNDKLARNYYKRAMLELTDQERSMHAHKKALDYIDQALNFDQKSEYQAFKATLLFELNQVEKSKVCFEQALALSSDARLKAEIMNNYACLLAQMGEYEKARSVWHELEHDSYYLTPEVALVNQGKSCVAQADYASAKQYFLQAITIAPSYLDAHFYTALVAHKTDDIPLAKNSLSTVLFLEPDHKDARKLADQLGVS